MPQFDFDKNYIKYIIFDLDGVLINSEPVSVKSAISALSEIGISAKHDDFNAYIGAGEDKLSSLAASTARKAPSTRQ